MKDREAAVVNRAPVKATRTIEVTVWDCGISEHHHRTENGARRCLDKRSRRREKKRIKRDWTPADRARLLDERRSGESVRQLAEKYGQSVSRISVLLNEARSEKRCSITEGGETDDLFNRLSVRACRALRSHGLDSPGKVRAATEIDLLKIPNIGKLTLVEIKRIFRIDTDAPRRSALAKPLPHETEIHLSLSGLSDDARRELYAMGLRDMGMVHTALIESDAATTLTMRTLQEVGIWFEGYRKRRYVDDCLYRLSVRTLNTLLVEGIRTMEQLRRCKTEELAKIPGLGRVGLADITSLLGETSSQ
jgi:hypothetical protein